jgi:hypothetical protein
MSKDSATPDGCPVCKRPLKEGHACWGAKCSYRACERCGGNTGSPFIRLCLRCGLLDDDEAKGAKDG